MRLPYPARLAIGLSVLLIAAAGAYAGSASWLKRRAIAEGQARGFVVDVGSARLGFFSAHLKGVRVGLEGVTGLDVDLAEIDIAVEASGRPSRIAARGGQVRVVGDAEQLASQLEAWRARRPAPAVPASTTSTSPVVSVTGLEGKIPLPGGGTVVLSDASVERDGEELRLKVASLHAERGEARADVRGASIALVGRKLKLLTAESASLELVLPEPKEDAGATAAVEPTPPALPTPVIKRGKKSPPLPAEPMRVTLPDAAPLRAIAQSMAKRLSELLVEGADAKTEQLSLVVTRGKDKLTLGPGALTLMRSPEHVEVEFRTSAATQAGTPSGTPLSARVDLPTASGDLRATLSGGPVSLTTLGVKEGAFGLIDVPRAQLTGKATFKIDTAGAASFDADVLAKGLGLERAWLARAPVHGLDVGLRLSGFFESRKRLRIDDAEAALGAFRGRFRGTLEASGDVARVNGSFEVPTTACQSLIDSVPDALMPTVKGARFVGTFGAQGSLVFDSSALDDLELSYRFDDRCRFIEVPKPMDRERFRKPFVHRIVRPDGKEAEMTTGPDSAAWTPLELISPYMQAAVLTTEDGAFFKHHGFNHAAIKNSLVANLKAKRFVRGASTISMQLAKNLFLSRQKTLSRKLEEVVLTDYLEQTFSKDELMELYLNVIEFGPNLYGIGAASEHYYARKPEELNLTESMFLATLLPRPVEAHRMYERGAVGEGWAKNLRSLVEIAFRTGKVSEAERNEGLSQAIVFVKEGQPRPPPRPPASGTHGGGDEEWKVID